MKLSLLLGAIPALVSAAAAGSQSKNYDGYRVVRVKTSPAVNKVIKDKALDTWTGRPDDVDYADVVIPPGFKAFDGIANLEVMHENLGNSIADEANFTPLSASYGSSAAIAAAPTLSYFNSYHSYADHLTFLRDLQSSFPANSEIFGVGNTGQGRNITGIHFWGSSGKNQKPAVVIHGTVHAREWATTMVTEYVAWTLISNYTRSATIKSLVDKYDYYFIPVVNPDGFTYSQTNDRLWRKNRQSVSGNTCLGTDVNRNWPYQWAQSGGASTNPCAQDFKGASAGNTLENQRLRAQLDSLAASKGVQMYIDIHSYSQLFMTPYGYDCNRVVANNAAYQSLVQGAANAIRNAGYGTVFETGPICSTIYQVSGSSVDYVADVSKAKYSLTTELRDTGRYGFVLPANQIIPSGIEFYAGFQYLLQNI